MEAISSLTEWVFVSAFSYGGIPLSDRVGLCQHSGIEASSSLKEGDYVRIHIWRLPFHLLQSGNELKGGLWSREEWMKDASEDSYQKKLYENEAILSKEDIDSVMCNCTASPFMRKG